MTSTLPLSRILLINIRFNYQIDVSRYILVTPNGNKRHVPPAGGRNSRKGGNRETTYVSQIILKFVYFTIRSVLSSFLFVSLSFTTRRSGTESAREIFSGMHNFYLVHKKSHFAIEISARSSP